MEAGWGDRVVTIAISLEPLQRYFNPDNSLVRGGAVIAAQSDIPGNDGELLTC
jgi:hypothetical protein